MALCRLAEIVFTRGGHTFFRNESDQRKQNINGTFLLYNGGARENEYKELSNDFYAEKGFVLPPISAVNISQLDIFVYDGTDKRANIPILTFTDYNDIEHFLLHYQDYISKYTSENSGDLVCFIKYKNYTFEEQLDEYELAELL